MKTRTTRSVLASLAFCLALSAYHAASTVPVRADASKALNFGAEESLGRGNKNLAAPFLRFAEDTRAAITEYLKEAKINFPVALDLNNTVKRSYRIFGPATFFIDGQGVLCNIVLGPITRERALEALKKTGVAKD